MKSLKLVQLVLALCAALLVTACGGEETTDTYSAVVNPALISRNIDSVTLELGSPSDQSQEPAPTGATIISVTLDGVDVDVEAFEFTGTSSLTISLKPTNKLMRGSNELVITVESDDGVYQIIGQVEVM